MKGRLGISTVEELESLEREKINFKASLANGKIVNCKKIVRYLPGKRIVCLGQYDTEEVIIKWFFDKNHAIRAEDELRGLSLLSRAGVATCRVIEATWLADKKASCLIIEYVSHKKPLPELFEEIEREATIKVIFQVIDIIANMHSANVVQGDVHLKNFLLSGDTLVAIDGGDIKEEKSIESLYSNFALFLAQLELVYDQYTDIFCQRYIEKYSPDLEEEKFISKIKKLRFELRQTRVEKYGKKSLRDCTEFYYFNDKGVKGCCRREFYSKDLIESFRNINPAIANSKLLKDGNSATVAILRYKQYRWVVKRYNPKSDVNQLKYLVAPTRAERSWINGNRLCKLGVRTPRPVAYFSDSNDLAYYISEYISGETLDKYLEAHMDGEMVEKMLNMMGLFSEYFISHGDMKSRNFMVSEAGKLYVIDLDSMRFHGSSDKAQKRVQKDRERFLQNWPKESELWSAFYEGLNETINSPA